MVWQHLRDASAGDAEWAFYSVAALQRSGILWVNYFDDGRGIHYYPRASYGFPQSAGCVEEPYASAPVTYRYLHYGVPVTVSASVFHSSKDSPTPSSAPSTGSHS